MEEGGGCAVGGGILVAAGGGSWLLDRSDAALNAVVEVGD